MSKQTAVEWLLRELELHQQGLSEYYSQAAIRNHAHRMEREQIEQSYSDGLGNGCHYERGEAAESVLDEKQYYERTYGKEAGHE